MVEDGRKTDGGGGRTREWSLRDYTVKFSIIQKNRGPAVSWEPTAEG